MPALAEFQTIALDKIHESPLNPRKHFDQAKLQELAASIREKGILTPLLVRPNAKGFEIGAGHRRYRAATLAELRELPCVVRDMTDTEFLELLVIENDQREDVHPLEQADGYKRLMLLDGYDAKRIADRIGRSEKFVYDRVKLLALTPLAQQLFLAGKMSAGHAILLARLTPEQQGLAIGKGEEDDRYHTGLFVGEGAGDDLFEEDKPRPKGPLAPYEDMKPVSVRELDHWIAEHVRFDPKKADPFLFPAVVTAVTEAPKALVPITHNSDVQDEARDGKVRTYGPASWKDATKKACPYTQGAVIVVGEGRGDVLQVCLSSHRDQCATHWAKEKKAAAARRKQMARGGSTRRADNTYEKQEERRKAERAAQEASDARYMKAAPAIVTAIAAAIDKASLDRIGKKVLEYVAPNRHQRPVVKLDDFHQAGKTADSILRQAAFLAQFRELDQYRIVEELAGAGKAWGVDVKAILEKEAPAPKPEKLAVQTSAKKKGGPR